MPLSRFSMSGDTYNAATTASIPSHKLLTRSQPRSDSTAASLLAALAPLTAIGSEQMAMAMPPPPLAETGRLPYPRRRLPIFVHLTEREARRRQRVSLVDALLAELAEHQQDIGTFKRLHTARLELLERERVAPMEAAVAAVMANATTTGSGRRGDQTNGRTARAAAAARQRARLSPARLSMNRTMSERAVTVLMSADLLEERGLALAQAAKATLTAELGQWQTRHGPRYRDDDDDESDASVSDHGSSTSGDESVLFSADAHATVPVQLDRLALAVERLRHATADFVRAYPV